MLIRFDQYKLMNSSKYGLKETLKDPKDFNNRGTSSYPWLELS